MIALHITDSKKMMQSLLHASSFDNFSMQEVSVIKDISFFLEGRRNPDYFTAEDFDHHPELHRQRFALWGEYREQIAAFMQGDKAHLSFKFVLQAPESYMQKLLTNPDFTADPSLVQSLNLTFRYESGILTCLTGTAFTTFVPDKSLDGLWDRAIRKSLENMQIGYEDM